MQYWYTAFPALHLSTAVHAAVAASCGSRLGGEKPLHVTSVQKQFSQFGEEEAGLLCVPKPGRPPPDSCRKHQPSRTLKPSLRPQQLPPFRGHYSRLAFSGRKTGYELPRLPLRSTAGENRFSRYF